jgi:hypothetical protein
MVCISRPAVVLFNSRWAEGYHYGAFLNAFAHCLLLFHAVVHAVPVSTSCCAPFAMAETPSGQKTYIHASPHHLDVRSKVLAPRSLSSHLDGMSQSRGHLGRIHLGPSPVEQYGTPSISTTPQIDYHRQASPQSANRLRRGFEDTTKRRFFVRAPTLLTVRHHRKQHDHAMSSPAGPSPKLPRKAPAIGCPRFPSINGQSHPSARHVFDESCR